MGADAVDAGAKFFTMMAQHHDRFSLYDSDHTEWDSVDKGPMRDLCREMKEAVTKRGLRFGVSNHMAWNSTFFNFYHGNGYAKLPGHDKYRDLYSGGVTDEHSGTQHGPRDVRYTRSKNGKTLYATVLAWPGTRPALVSAKVLNQSENAQVTMLANGRSIPLVVDKTHRLILDLSGIDAENAGCDHAYAFRIEGFRIEGFRIEGVKLSSLERSELYMQDTTGYEPKIECLPIPISLPERREVPL